MCVICMSESKEKYKLSLFIRSIVVLEYLSRVCQILRMKL